MTKLISYIATYIAPISILLLGIIILTLVGYINWYGKNKVRVVKWIARKIYRGCLGSETLADGMFMTLTSFLLAIGGILILYSLLFFQ